jgi:hypothetical protein
MQKMLCKYNAILWIGFLPRAYKASAQWAGTRLAQIHAGAKMHMFWPCGLGLVLLLSYSIF